MILHLVIALLAAFILFILLMLLARRQAEREKNFSNRMAYFAGVDVSLRHTQQNDVKRWGNADGSLKSHLYEAVRSLGSRLEKIKKSHSLDNKLQQAAWPLLGSEFQVVMLGVGAAGGVLLGLLTMTPVNGLLGFIMGCLLCMILLKLRIQRRQKAFANQLGDMLTMIANALRAGFSFMQALDHIAHEMDDPVQSEVKKVVRDVNMGIPLEEALESMVQRINSSDFNLVVSAVLIQRQVGGNLAQILDAISETITDRIRMRREVNTLTAQGKMSGIVLGCLPIGLAIFLQIVNPGYLKPLFESTIGQMAVAGAVFLMIIGFLVIRKIVNIEL